ncbi:MAG: WD40 repeat domain-containing protein [Phycisphaerales bacterium]|nr:WD40 repeat domain-containing protein [Phycisphaerales bacterium]
MNRLFMLLPVLLGLLLSQRSVAREPTSDSDPIRESYRAHLAAALSSYRLAEYADARRWLDGAPIPHRCWEWSYLDSMLDQSTVLASSLASPIVSVTINSSGTTAALAMHEGPIVLWDISKSTQIAELAGHKGGTYCVRFSPDGARLASSGVDRIARIWDITSGKPLIEFKDHKFPVAGITFTADGNHALSAAYYTDKETPIEGRVHLWDLTSGHVIRTYKGGVKPISSIALSPDGKLIAAGSWDSAVFVWDFANGGEPRKLGGPVDDRIVRFSSVCFSPDSSLLVAGSDFDWAKVYRVSDSAEVATLGHPDDVNAVAFSPDGRTLATGAGNGSIALWNCADWKQTATLCGHTASVSSLSWAPGGSAIVSGGADRSLRSWDPTRKDYGGGIRTTVGTSNYSVAFSPDGGLLACSAYNGKVTLMDSHTGISTAQWLAHDGSPACTAAFSPDGKSVASCSWDKTVRIFTLQTREQTAKVDCGAGVTYIAWDTASQLLAAALTNGKTALIDAKTAGIVRTLEGHERNVQSVDFSADGRYLVTAGTDRTARLWDVQTGIQIAILRGHTAGLHTAIFIPGDQGIATAGDDGSVRLWNAADGQPIRTLHAGDEPIHRLAATPDGNRLAAIGKHLYILDPASSSALLKAAPISDTLWHASWSPDGERLAVTSWGGEVAILGRRSTRD